MRHFINALVAVVLAVMLLFFFVAAFIFGLIFASVPLPSCPAPTEQLEAPEASA